MGIDLPGEVDGERIGRWLSSLLKERGTDIFRMKGVIAVKGAPQRVVFQGVHMLMDSRDDRPWGREPRHNKLVFIGRNLDRGLLHEGFRACLA